MALRREMAFAVFSLVFSYVVRVASCEMKRGMDDGEWKGSTSRG